MYSNDDEAGISLDIQQADGVLSTRLDVPPFPGMVLRQYFSARDTKRNRNRGSGIKARLSCH